MRKALLVDTKDSGDAGRTQKKTVHDPPSATTSARNINMDTRVNYDVNVHNTFEPAKHTGG